MHAVLTRRWLGSTDVAVVLSHCTAVLEFSNSSIAIVALRSRSSTKAGFGQCLRDRRSDTLTQSAQLVYLLSAMGTP